MSSSPIDHWKDALISLCQFVYIGEKEFVKDKIQGNAVEITLFLNKDKEPISFQKLQTLIAKSPWEVTLPTKVLEQTCRILQKDNKVSISKDEVYLNHDRRLEIEREVKNNKNEKQEIEKLFIDNLVSEYRKIAGLPLMGNDQVLCSQLFWKYVSKLLNSKTNIVTQVISSPTFKMDSSFSGSIFSDLNEQIDNVNLSKSFRQSFNELFEQRVGKFFSFLYKSSQVLTCWKIFSLNPSVDVIKEKEFARKKIILDTNFLMGLFCTNYYNHKSTKELVQLTGKTGAKLFVTSQTVKEFKKVLGKSNERFALLNVPPRILKGINDGFISSYALEQESDQSLTWQSYFEKMSDVAKLAAEYSIDVIEVGDIYLADNEIYQKVVDDVIRVWEVARNYKKERDVAEHDAFHLLLIKKLRDEDRNKGILGPNYWFLTRDSTLYAVNSFINSLGLFQNQMSSSIRESSWLDFIMPFLNSSNNNGAAYTAFSDLLQSEFVSINRGISPKILIEIQGEWTKYEWLSVTDIEEILKDTALQTLTSKLSKLDPNDVEAKTVVNETKQHFDTLLSQKFNERIGVFQNQMDDAKLKIASISQSLSEKEQEVNNLTKEVSAFKLNKKVTDRYTVFWRCIAGIIGVILIAVAIYTHLTNFEPTINSTAVNIVMIVGGAIFVLMAIAYEQVKAILAITLGK